jgi:hypothetical protein
MKGWLIITTLGVGFLAGLGAAAVRGDLWQPPAAPVQGPAAILPLPAPAEPPQAAAVHPVAAAPAPEPTAEDPESEGRNSDASGAAPTYEQQSAAHDRAAAHSARSR